jgi:hypothetical protein
VTKSLLNSVKVVVNNVDLSKWAFDIDTPDTKAQVDVSGFSATLTKEYLPGLADQTITVRFLQDFAVGAVHATLNGLYYGGSTFPIYVQNDMTQGTSATNPLYGGSANMYEYDGLSGQLEARSEITVTFRPAPNSKFTWGTVAP